MAVDVAQLHACGLGVALQLDALPLIMLSQKKEDATKDTDHVKAVLPTIPPVQPDVRHGEAKDLNKTLKTQALYRDTCQSPRQAPSTPIMPLTKLGENYAERAFALSTPVSDDFLSKRLTVLVFTSPIPSHPSLEMLLTVIESFKFIPGLTQCPLLVTCDGPGLVCGEVRPKRGFVTKELFEQYKCFVARLRDLIGNDRVLELPEREGFGRAVRAAVARVTTPYVLICQHDNMFVRPVDLRSVVHVMEHNEDILKCVHLVSPKATFSEKSDGSKELYRIEDRLGRIAGEVQGFEAPPFVVQKHPAEGPSNISMKFWPMPSWLERNHVCSTAHYRDFVLGPNTRIKQGQFIEETFGQRMRADLKNGGSHKDYGIFRLLDVPESATIHLDGRSYLPMAERRARGWTVPHLYRRLELEHENWIFSQKAEGACQHPRGVANIS